MGRPSHWTRAATVACALPIAACAHLPRVGTNLLPPVVPYAIDADTVMSGRQWARLRERVYDLYVQTPTIATAVDEHLQATARQFARHFGAAPRVAVLVFDAPADPPAEFDFSAFQRAHVQVLALVRSAKARDPRDLGIDEALLRARLAELFLASYADSLVAARTGRRDAETTGGARAVERLPHWFAEAVISRVARPETVEPGLAYVRANRPHLVPLQRLFRVERLGAPAWCELVERRLPSLSSTAPRVAPPPALVAAESTVFGEFLVDRYGPTFLQAVGDALLDGVRSEWALAVAGEEGAGLERAWGEWLAGR